MSAIWFAFLIAVAIVVMAEALRGLLPSVLQAMPAAVELRRERTEMELEFSRRRQHAQEMVMQRNLLINDRTELETRLIQLQSRQHLLDLDRPMLVIELGEPRGDNKMFRAGVCSIVLEGVPREVAALITADSELPAE